MGKAKPDAPFQLIKQGPPLTKRAWQRLESTLRDQFGITKLPPDYAAFLLQHNGGYVSPGHVDDTSDTEHREEMVFETPLVWARDGNRPVRPCLVMFFFAWVAEEMDDPPDDEEMYELVSSNAYSRFDFDVLPDGMMSIAKCSHPHAADMLCLDLSAADFGAVYYHYDKWYYPGNFHGDYYAKREAEVRQRGGDIEDALKRVPFVRVASSFREFLQSLQRVAVN